MMKLDTKIDNLEDRLEYINNNLTYGTLEEYSKGFEVLEGDNYKLMELELMGSYLLQKVQKEDKEKIQIVTQKEFDDNNRKGEKTIAVAEDTLSIIKNEKNHYKSNVVKVTQKILSEETELGEILREYETYRDKLREELDKQKKGIKTINSNGKIRKHLTEIKADMVLTIKYKKGLDYERKPQIKYVGDAIDLDSIDYSCKTHIKAILKNISLDMGIEPNSTQSLIAYDMVQALKVLHSKNKISDIDLAIAYKCCGTTTREIGKEVGLTHVTIAKRIDKISKIIAEYYQ